MSHHEPVTATFTRAGVYLGLVAYIILALIIIKIYL